MVPEIAFRAEQIYIDCAFQTVGTHVDFWTRAIELVRSPVEDVQNKRDHYIIYICIYLIAPSSVKYLTQSLYSF